jgi:DNA topoisomerase-1
MRRKKQIGDIPINPEDVKRFVEVPVHNIPKDKIVTIERPAEPFKPENPEKPKKTRKPRTRKKKENLESESETREMKSDRPVEKIEKHIAGEYTLILTEKPQAAAKIADALGKAKRLGDTGVPYYEVTRDGEKIVVAAAAGHLFTLSQKTRGPLPIFDLEWVPSYEKKAAFTKKFYQTLARLGRSAKNFVVATDYDIEGEVIGLNIIRYIFHQKDAKRMKYSTLTAPELNYAYSHLMPTIDWGQAIAGETRHYLDWMYGINLSRALMEAIRKTGSFKIMSIGRVQGPALRMVVDKELEIQSFKSSAFWQIYITILGTRLKYHKDITNKQELKKFEGLKGKTASVKTDTKEESIMPPAPFDLTTLQIEAYKHFKINPARTLQICQHLYLSGLISYPRTSSQKIPESISPGKILNKLAQEFKFVELVTRKKPVEGSKSDPAHPSIYPTGDIARLAGEEKNIYELIVKRFVSCFCSDAKISNKVITAEVEGLKFVARGLEILEEGWMKVYPARMQEKMLKDINGDYPIQKVDVEEKETQPPHRYTPASLVSELARRNLGTKATRAAIVETLYEREYIKEQSIKATPLGIKLIDTLKVYSPVIIDDKLTRSFEKEMDSIISAKKDLDKKEAKIIDDAKTTITKIVEDFKKHETKIGEKLADMIKEQREQTYKENILMKCPKCQKGDLRMLFNRAWRRYFVACSGYPECKTTFSLPPNALIKKTDKVCELCGWPMMMSLKKGKRPWIFCFNPACKSRADREAKKPVEGSEE